MKTVSYCQCLLQTQISLLGNNISLPSRYFWRCWFSFPNGDMWWKPLEGTPPKINGWNMKMMVWFRWFSSSRGVFSGEPAVNLPGCRVYPAIISLFTALQSSKALRILWYTSIRFLVTVRQVQLDVCNEKRALGYIGDDKLPSYVGSRYDKEL